MTAIAYALIGALTVTTAGAAAADDMSNMKGMSAAPAAKHGQVSWPAMTSLSRPSRPCSKA
jgi:hypothetical protein